MPDMAKSPYEILGVAPTAKQDEVRKAYRKLAKALHPDLNPGDATAEARFKEVTQAHQILSDPERRGRYDRGEIDASGAERAERPFYRAYADGDAGDGAQYWHFASGDGGGAGGFAAEDLFSELFGRGRAAPGGEQFRMRGQDVTYTLRCAFLDAVNGARRRVTLSDGKTLDVDIPAGTADRQTLRLRGQGMPGIGGGETGDAYIEIHIEPHAFFTRKDEDIHLELPVTLPEAVLGAKINVPTVDGRVALTVPPGSNTGDTLRLRGKGVKRPKGSGRGDQYVTLKVVLPDEPDDALKSFLEEWSQTHGYDVRSRAGMA